jgi:hypothetical protein
MVWKKLVIIGILYETSGRHTLCARHYVGTCSATTLRMAVVGLHIV